MGVHIRSVAEGTGGGTVLSLHGSADAGLLAMLAEGIGSITSPSRAVIVDIEHLSMAPPGGDDGMFADLIRAQSRGPVIVRGVSG